MIRSIIFAAMLVPASAALAQAPVAAGHGAIAGRSPHQAYTHKAGATACRATMHTQPAGKLPSYGTFHHPDPACDQSRVVASADKKDAARRD